MVKPTLYLEHLNNYMKRFPLLVVVLVLTLQTALCDSGEGNVLKSVRSNGGPLHLGNNEGTTITNINLEFVTNNYLYTTNVFITVATTNFFLFSTNLFISNTTNNSYISNYFNTNVFNNEYVSNYFNTNLYNYVTNNITYSTNLTVTNFYLTDEYVSNFFNTNIFVNNSIVSNFFTTNLYNTINITSNFTFNVTNLFNPTNATLYGVTTFSPISGNVAGYISIKNNGGVEKVTLSGSNSTIATGSGLFTTLTAGSYVGVGAGGLLINTNPPSLATATTNFSVLSITNGVYFWTNSWAGPTSTVPMYLTHQRYDTFTPVSITGITGKSNYVTEHVLLSIKNKATTG